jgi:hypothetical protein
MDSAKLGEPVVFVADGGIEYAAVVTYVHNATMVNLLVLNGNQESSEWDTMKKTSVAYSDSGQFYSWHR